MKLLSLEFRQLFFKQDVRCVNQGKSENLFLKSLLKNVNGMVKWLQRKHSGLGLVWREREIIFMGHINL